MYGDVNPDKASLDALHAQAVAIAAARASGDVAAQQAAVTAFNQIAAARNGFTQAQLDAEIAVANAQGDPLGLATFGTGLGLLGGAALLGVVVYALHGKGGRRDW
jgi:hypothetical protein